MGNLNSIVLGGFTAFMNLGVFVVVPGTTMWLVRRHPICTCFILALYGLSYFDGAQVNVKKDRTWAYFSKYFFLWRFMREFFPQKLHVPPNFPAVSDKPGEKLQYIFGFHPHGTMSDYRLLVDGQFLDQLPGLQGKIRWLAASVLFRLPIAREICLWTRCIDARRDVAEQVLKEGLSVGVIPGGEAEQLRTTFGTDEVYLNKRLGFVKLALRFGVPLVPVYVFGCVDVYRTSSIFFGLREKLVNAVGVCVPICWGPYGLPFTPLKQPVDIVIGQPLDVGVFPKPTDEQVVEAHAKYVNAVKALYDENKSRFGYGDRQLKIV